MVKWIKRLVLVAVVAYGGFRAVDGIETLETQRHDTREAVTQQIGEKRARQMQATSETHNTIRTDAMREELQRATQGRDSLALP